MLGRVERAKLILGNTIRYVYEGVCRRLLYAAAYRPGADPTGQIQKAPPVYGSFYACYSYRYPQETPRPLPECRQILGELSAAGGRADTVGRGGSVRKLSEVPTRSAGRGGWIRCRYQTLGADPVPEW